MRNSPFIDSCSTTELATMPIFIIRYGLSILSAATFRLHTTALKRSYSYREAICIGMALAFMRLLLSIYTGGQSFTC